MKLKIELVLSYLVFSIACIYGVLAFAQLNYRFTHEQMSIPGMVITFVIACTFNVFKIKEGITNSRIHFGSIFANMLAFSYALGFVYFDPWIGKVITTAFMGIIFILSIVNAIGRCKEMRCVS